MKLVVAIAVSIVMGMQAQAATIPLGTHKLKWRSVMRYQDIRLPHIHLCDLTPLKDLKKPVITGTSSSNALYMHVGRMSVILDETKGTGTGFNMAYLYADAAENGSIDVKNAAPSPLSRRYGGLTSDFDDPPIVNWTMGSGESRVVQPAGFLVSVHDYDSRPRSASVALLGHWRAIVQTNSGPMLVETHDMNLNGVYDDRMTYEKGDRDSVAVYNSTRFGKIHHMPLGVASNADGELYTINVNKVGDEVEIQPYTGDTGKIRITSQDANGKLLKWDGLALDGMNGHFSFDPGKDGEFTVPPGSYSVSIEVKPKWQVKNDDKNDLTDDFGLYLSSDDAGQDSKAEIQKDQVTKFKVGGPFGVRLSDGCSSIKLTNFGCYEISRSKVKVMGVEFTLGTQVICGGYSDRMPKPVVTLRDSQGKIVRRSMPEDGLMGTGVEIGKKWPPGRYILDIRLDPRPYQKPLHIAVTISITN